MKVEQTRKFGSHYIEETIVTLTDRERQKIAEGCRLTKWLADGSKIVIRSQQEQP